jgi:DNA polymerase III epsilon subunit-like protein
MPYTIFFDLETGGVEPQHPTIQLAAVVIDESSWQEVASFERKISFIEADAQPEALAMNHYDAAVWAKESVSPTRAAYEFAAFCKPYLCIQMISKRTGAPYMVGKLAGHNALIFDLPRLRQLFGTSFFPFSYHVKDTLQRALWFFDEHPAIQRPENLKLGTLCEAFGIKTNGSHEALTDVRLAAALAKKFYDSQEWSSATRGL